MQLVLLPTNAPSPSPFQCMPVQMPVASTSISATRAHLPTLTSGHECQVALNPSLRGWCLNTPAPLPLGYAGSEACVVYWLPDHPRRIKVHLPLGITNLVTNPLSAAFPSLTHFSNSPFGVSWDHLSDKLLTLKSLSQSLLLSNSGTEVGHPHRNTSVIGPSALCSTTTAQLQSGSQLHRHCPLSHPAAPEHKHCSTAPHKASVA